MYQSLLDRLRWERAMSFAWVREPIDIRREDSDVLEDEEGAEVRLGRGSAEGTSLGTAM